VERGAPPEGGLTYAHDAFATGMAFKASIAKANEERTVVDSIVIAMCGVGRVCWEIVAMKRVYAACAM